MSEQTNAPLELAPEGYAALNAHFEKMERSVNEGIIHPEKALECCREIRLELFQVQRSLREVCVIPQTAAKEDSSGEAA